MINKFISGQSGFSFHRQLLTVFLLGANGTALALYGCFRFIFFDFPFAADESMLLLKLSGAASALAVAAWLLVLLANVAEFIFKRKQQPAFANRIKIAATVLAVLTTVLALSCKAPVVTGIKKDFNTGLSTSYTAMEPEKAFIVMNNEVLNHTDIPLGESFLIVNDNIKGLQEKNGKVNVGCSLQIADAAGKLLLDEKDLFAGHDEFDAKEAKMLKCTVNTGEPMRWEEKYNVTVVFWDKNGNGRIENKVSIRSINMP